MRISWKEGQILPTFDYTVTVLNKLKAQDSITRQDVWYKTVIPNCAFSKRAETAISGNTVSNGAAYIVRIPKDARFLPYHEWKNNPDGHFTISGGDYIICGEIEEQPTAQTIISIYNKYREDACKVTYTKNNTGTIELAEHYHIEGV